MTREEIFRDYEAFVAKFERLAAKTTDECITPPEVYCAVIEWLDSEGLLNGRPIVRPFFPGGDYQNHDYPEGCIVVDNPPFSKSAEILRFYTENHIDFFLFPPKHPYFPKGCGNCEFKLSYDSNNEKCRACRIIQNNANEVIKESKKSSKDKKRIKSGCEKFIKTLPSITIGSEISHQKVITTANGDKIRVGKTFFNETFSKNIHNKQLEEIMNLAMDFEKWMPNLPKGRIEKGIDHDFNFMAYEIKYNGYEIVFKTKLTEGQIAYTMRIKKRN